MEEAAAQRKDEGAESTLAGGRKQRPRGLPEGALSQALEGAGVQEEDTVSRLNGRL